MSRKKLPKSIETEVLTRSRRRCCICFGLDRSTDLVQGQIAHLDQDSSNNSLDNLAFLCLEHHDQYDSTTRQSKGLTRQEVLSYRAELYEALGDAFKQPVHFGSVQTPRNDPYAGNYTRLGTGNDSAEVVITPLPDGIGCVARYFVSGIALFGADRPYGPNIGEISAIVEYEEAGIAHYSYGALSTERPLDHDNHLTLKHDGDTLIIEESRNGGMYGAGVTFAGTYRRLQ